MEEAEIDRASVAAWLESLGYLVLEREDVWCECLLSAGPERWHGRGATRAEAFEDALRALFPSRAAREALASALAAAAPRADPADAPADPAADAPVAERTVDAAEDAEHPPREPDREAETTAAVARHEPPAVASGEERPSARARTLTPLERADALLALDELARAIEEDRAEGAAWSPERQRLLLLGWISHARSIDEASRKDREVSAAEHRVAQTILALSKTWWPGSVRALSLGSAPSDCSADLATEVVPGSWLEVAEQADARLTEIEEADRAAGLDEHGWADASALIPGPPDPESRLREIASRLEGLLGVDLPSSNDELRAALAPIDVAEWEALAARLRWTRRATEQTATWGALVGRLRRIAAQLPVQRRRGLADLLSPNHRPARTWALACGFDPERKARLRRKQQLLATVPRPEEAHDVARIERWLKDALTVQDLTPADIARALTPFSATVLAIDAGSFSSERNERKRLSKVQRRLSAPDGPDAERVSPPVAEDPSDLLDEPSAAASIDAELLDLVRPRTVGRTVLMVINRNDQELARRLEAIFGFERVDLCGIEPRRIASKVESVARGGFDYVFASTGFLPHKVDGSLEQACRASGTPYVRVNRGRPLACARHLARELGLRAAPPA